MLAHKGPQRITKPSRAVSVHDPQPPFIRNNRIVQSLLNAGHRVIETVLGIAVAWLLSLVPRLVEFKNPSGPEGS